VSLPLEGRRVLVTRSANQTAKLSDALRSLGCLSVEVPVLEIVPPESFALLDDALTHLDRFDWLIVTSTNTLHAISVRCQRFAVNPARAEALKVAAIGRATAEAARGLGLKVELVPDDQVAEGLVAVLREKVCGQRVLLPRAAIARDILPDALRAAGAIVDVVDAYRNVLPEAAPGLLRAALEQGIDAITFTSSSSVTHLAEAAHSAGLTFPFAGIAAISIGPITSQTLREHGWEPAAEANPSNIRGLAEAVASVLSRN
jgi:uroporphyrinogen-III synthase/uroporphyrinogen III methyltransferase/synthase